MKVNAYLLAAAPEWAAASVMSYYSHVGRIVVSYDRDGIGWNGKPVEASACVKVLRELDTEGKLEFLPGNFHRSESTPFENETFQRQEALDCASSDCDWVVQLDSDEALGCSATFFQALQSAAIKGFASLYYPSRWLYQHLAGDLFLERSNRWWQIAASYPGPMAVIAGSKLRHARQCDSRSFRVDFRKTNTDYWSSSTSGVNKVIDPAQGILHYAWIRDKRRIELKLANHGDLHGSYNQAADIWMWVGRHPALAVVTTPGLRRFRGRPMLRPAVIAPPNPQAASELRKMRSAR